MRQRLPGGHAFELLGTVGAKWSAGRGHDQPRDLRRWPSAERLPNRAVFAVDRTDGDAAATSERDDDFTRADDRLLVRERDLLPRFDRLDGWKDCGVARSGDDDDVGIRVGC